MPLNGLAKIVLFSCGLALFAIRPVGVSFANFSKSVTIANNRIAAISLSFDLSSPVKSSDVICNLINSKNWWSLYFVSAIEVKQSFTESEFTESFETSNVAHCEIISNPTYLSSTWAKTEIEIVYADLPEKSFYLALKKEGSEWKMFGTEGRWKL